MRQKTHFGSAKVEKFEDGVLRADACMDRYSIPRQAQYCTWQEDLPANSFGLSAVFEERRLINAVHRLISAGLRPSSGESLEDFVQRHQDLSGEEVA